MYATIMVPGLGDGSDDASLNMALVWGKAFDAHIDFVRVRRQVGAGVRDIGAFLPQGNLGDAYVKLVEDTDEQHAAAAKAAYAKALARVKTPESRDPEARGALTLWAGEANVTDIVGEARYRDLVVTAAGAESVASDLVIGCGRPVILAPAKTPDCVTRTVAVAWKNTPEAARAVGAAMPLLRKAERVVVISANETEGGTGRTVKSANRLIEQLAWHGIAAEPHTILSQVHSAVDAVLEVAHDVGADVLVMGAYSHSRAREYVFGGFTHHVLHNQTLPVFLFH